MIGLTDHELDVLGSAFQIGADEYRARLEVDEYIPAVAPLATPAIVQSVAGWSTAAGVVLTLPAAVTPGNLLVYIACRRQGTPVPPNTSAFEPRFGSGAWTDLVGAAVRSVRDGHPTDLNGMVCYAKVADDTSNVGWVGSIYTNMAIFELAGCSIDGATIVYQDEHASGTDIDIGSLGSPASDLVAILIASFGVDGSSVTVSHPGWTRDWYHDHFGWGSAAGDTVTGGAFPYDWIGHTIADGSALEAQIAIDVAHQWGGLALVFAPSDAGSDATLATHDYQVARFSRNVSRRLAAAELQLEIEIPDGAAPLVLPDGTLRTNAPCRLFAWYGAVENEVLAFDGLADELVEARDPRNLAFTCRDYLKPAIVQHVNVTAPQQAGEAGAVRTPANGVYLNMEASDIVADLLTRWAGYPSADLEISDTGYVIAEYIVGDDISVAEAIIGDDKLTGLTGYNLRARSRSPRIVFAPALSSKAPDSDTDPVADYGYVVGAAAGDPLTNRNVLSLSHSIDEYDLRTRVKVTGNLGVLKDAWTEEWHTTAIRAPVGIWYDPTDTSHIRVLDKYTHRLYRFKTTPTRKVVSSVAVAGINYPIGLSGDPGDAAHYWILDAPFWTTGSITGNRLRKVSVATDTVVASYVLPDGKWTALKVSASFVWLTSWSDDKLHKYSKVGVAIASYTIHYSSTAGLPQTGAGAAQINPTGVMVDGTDLYVFFYGTNRFLKVSEAAPTTVTKVISTAGTRILGGEMNTTTHTEMWGDSDVLHTVWAYTLLEPSTRAISVEVVDSDLEDELGLLSGRVDREHDTHPAAPDHPFEIRREVLRVEKVLDNMAQATETAQRRLALVALRRETLDFGIVGNPGSEVDDLLAMTDPVTGIDALYVLDTYRDDMSPDAGWLGKIAVLPYDPVY